MKLKVRGAAAVLVLSGSLACSKPSAPPAEDAAQAPAAAAMTDAQIAEKGKAVIGAFKKKLLGMLSAAMNEGGPAKAIPVCSDEAPALALDMAGSGVRVGRTSHKLRNPSNAPAAWMKPTLEEFAAKNGGEPRVVRLPDGGAGYIEPLMTQELCVSCHGAQIAPEVQAQLDKLYPHDQATGFTAGDLRGIVWAELSPEALRRPSSGQ